MCMHSLMSANNETHGSLWCSGLKVSVTKGCSTSTPGALPFVKWSISCLIKFRLILSLPHPPSCGQKPCFSKSNDGKGKGRGHSQHSLWLVIVLYHLSLPASGSACKAVLHALQNCRPLREFLKGPHSMTGVGSRALDDRVCREKLFIGQPEWFAFYATIGRYSLYKPNL